VGRGSCLEKGEVVQESRRKSIQYESKEMGGAGLAKELVREDNTQK